MECKGGRYGGDNAKRKMEEPIISYCTSYLGLRSLEAERENLKMIHKAVQVREGEDHLFWPLE